MIDYEIMFKDSMFVYSAETVKNPSKLKVTIPEVFLDKKPNTVEEIRLVKGSNNIFLNENPPALSNSIISKNYLELPIANSLSGVIGKVYAGDRFVAQFIGNSPSNGIITARC